MKLTTFVAALAGGCLATSAMAQSDALAQIAELRAQLAAVQAQAGNNTLTEERANEIKSIVRDTLADADTRTSLQGGGAMAGYDNGFFMSSADGNFKLKMGVLEQVRFVWQFDDADTMGFENRRTQAFFSGNVVDPTWKYIVGMAYDSQTDPYVQTAGSFQLLYANISKSFGNGFSVSVGQMNVPWTVESQLFNAGSTQMGDYSIFEYTFGAGQQVGALASYEQDMWRVKGGWFNVVQNANLAGGTINAWNSADNQSIALAGRAEFKVAGTWEQFSKESSFKGEEFGLLVGGGVIWQNGRAINTVNTYNANPVGITVDAQAKFGGFNLIGQFVWQDGYPNGTGPARTATTTSRSSPSSRSCSDPRISLTSSSDRT